MNTDILDFIIKKNNLIIGDKLPIDIPNVSRFDLVKWLRELDFKTGVELGVADGWFSRIICLLNPQMKLYGVDAWVSYKGYKDYTRQATFENMYQYTLGSMRVMMHRGQYDIIRAFSMDAIKKFNDNSIDFIFIDANHEEPYISQDIIEWSKKVRAGGIVSGHDYIEMKETKIDVRDAIKKYTTINSIKPWFVLGSDAKICNQVREKHRTWMFVK